MADFEPVAYFVAVAVAAAGAADDEHGSREFCEQSEKGPAGDFGLGDEGCVEQGVEDNDIGP